MSYSWNGVKHVVLSVGPGLLSAIGLGHALVCSSLCSSRFLAFKTPLDERYDEQVAVEHRFSPGMLFQVRNGENGSAPNCEDGSAYNCENGSAPKG